MPYYSPNLARSIMLKKRAIFLRVGSVKLTTRVLKPILKFVFQAQKSSRKCQICGVVGENFAKTYEKWGSFKCKWD